MDIILSFYGLPEPLYYNGEDDIYWKGFSLQISYDEESGFIACSKKINPSCILLQDTFDVNTQLEDFKKFVSDIDWKSFD